MTLLFLFCFSSHRKARFYFLLDKNIIVYMKTSNFHFLLINLNKQLVLAICLIDILMRSYFIDILLKNRIFSVFEPSPIVQRCDLRSCPSAFLCRRVKPLKKLWPWWHTELTELLDPMEEYTEKIDLKNLFQS